LKIQLVHPPVYLNVHAMTALRPSMPLGLAYIAAVLEQAGHEVGVIDAVALAPEQVTPDTGLHRLGLGPDEIAERIDPQTQVIGVTNMWTFSWPLVRRILTTLKERFPDKILVCGGEHFTGLPTLSLEQAPIDYIVMGEGEETVVELLKKLAAGERDPGELPGVAFRRGGEIVINPRRDRVRDVDAIPWPAWQHFDLEAYNEHALVNGVRAGWTIPILATRGCPYQCTYCSSPTMWTTRWYPRDPIDVANEITQYVKTYGAKNFPFQDLTAIIKKDWIVAFCTELIRRNLDIVWQFPSGTRCEVIDDEVASLLARSGGRHLAFAPESGSENTRKLIKKKMTTEGLFSAVRASVRHDLNVTAFLVIGFPHDTKDDLKQTVKFVRRLAREGIDDIAIGFYFPIPNTALYGYLVDAGRVDYSDRCLMTPIYANDERLRDDNNYCEHLTAAQLTRTKYWFLLNFYPLSFLFHPGKALRIVANVVRGKETRKLETFLIELKRKWGMWFKTKLGIGSKPAAAQSATKNEMAGSR
jgi:anaerobic magnesium-protoporphyrin IX monomethyl ester cyclase